MATDIVFQRSIYSPAERGRKPLPGRQIDSGTELREAFERVQSDPAWQRGLARRKASSRAVAEVIDFYNAVVADGRHIRTFLEDPAKAARALKINVSRKSLDLVATVGQGLGESKIGAAVVIVSIAVVAIAIATAIQQSASDPRDRFVIDESGLIKL